MHLLILASMWVVYFILHSLLAAPSVKQRFDRRKYRLFYSTVATLGLLPIAAWMAFNPGQLLFERNTVVQFVGLAFSTYGFLVIKKAFRSYHTGAFLGFSNMPESQGLVRDGIFAKVRHPLYAGTILLAIGFAVFMAKSNALVSSACILAYLPIGIWLEEKKLIDEYGQDYLDYRKQVPAIIPKFG